MGCLKQWLLDTDIYDIHNTNDLDSTIFSTKFLEILMMLIMDMKEKLLFCVYFAKHKICYYFSTLTAMYLHYISNRSYPCRISKFKVHFMYSSDTSFYQAMEAHSY